MNIRALQQQRAKAVEDRRALLPTDDAPLDAEKEAEIVKLAAEIVRLDGLIAREAEQLEFERTSQAKAGSLPTVPHGTGVMTDNADQDARRGWRNFGEFVQAVHGAAMNPRAIDQRLAISAAAPGTYGNEGAGADGGFAVPPQYATDIFTLALGQDALLPMTDNVPVQSNSMIFPKDETTPWGTTGIRAYWQQEAQAATQTKPLLGATTMRLHKLMALVPMTDELIADWSAGGSYIAPLMARSIMWKTNEAILFGTGAGQPLGALNSSSAVVQAKDPGQTTKTLSLSNVTNMVARLVPNSGPSVWLITPDALPSLYQMTLGNYPIWLPINAGAQGTVEGTLLGRPVIKSQHAAAFSSQGDVILLALNWYRTITKAGAGIETAQSLHLYFDADAVAFRAVFRVDGMPKIEQPIAQAKGSNTLSPFIQLAAR